MENNRPVVLITGGARRVGRGIALHLASKGYDIALTYRSSPTEAAEVCSQISRLGGRAAAIRADLLDLPRAVELIFDELARFAPRLDAVVNNASIYKPDAEVEQAEVFWKIHVQAPLLLSRWLAPLLRQSRGCIINMCDILAERPMAGWLGYCASKAGLASLTRGLARELAPEVRVNGAAPGVAEWPASFAEEAKLRYLRRVPLGRAGTPEDIARLVHYLLTDGSYITGQFITMDGGRSIA